METEVRREATSHGPCRMLVSAGNRIQAPALLTGLRFLLGLTPESPSPLLPAVDPITPLAAGENACPCSVMEVAAQGWQQTVLKHICVPFLPAWCP